MKSYTEFKEAISAARLAQLAAKGKGDAAKAKMAADNLKSSAPSTTTTTKALPSGKGGALARRPSAQQKSKPGAIVKRPSSSGAIVRTKASPDKKTTKNTVSSNKGYMTAPDGPGKPDKPRTLTEPTGGNLGDKTKNKNKDKEKNNKTCPEGKIKVGGFCINKPKVSKLSTDNSVATVARGEVKGLQTKNRIDS